MHPAHRENLLTGRNVVVGGKHRVAPRLFPAFQNGEHGAAILFDRDGKTGRFQQRRH